MELPTEKKNAVVAAWLARVIEDYSESSARFFRDEKDPFRNPIGDAFRRGLPVLFDQLVGPMDPARLTPALEEIIRIRAVQDFTASQALTFIFQLKSVLREQLGDRPPEIEERIDEMALLAFDLYQQCREQLSEIKVNEIKKRYFLLEKMHPFFAQSDKEANTDEPRRDAT